MKNKQPHWTDQHHNEACIFWDLGGCNCGAIDMTKPPIPMSLINGLITALEELNKNSVLSDNNQLRNQVGQFIDTWLPELKKY